MNGTVISVANRKGGVGKTTIAISLASELRKRGKDIAVIDIDPQGSACAWAAPGNLTFPVYEITLDDRKASDWARDVRDVRAQCVIIDIPPSDRALGASIALSDIVLIPCTPSGLDLEATSRTIDIVEAVRARRPEPLNVIMVPNRVDIRTLEGLQFTNALNDFGLPVSPVIGYRSAFARAFVTGHSIADFAKGTPADREIKQLCDLVETLLPR